jgi:hypothetical protein
MTASLTNHHHWKHLVDYETVWILAYSAAVVGSFMFALLTIAQNNPNTLP